jgi:hypothetical protein
MRHFVFAARSTDPAPVGGGDAASWLKFYKLDPEEEVFIPRVAGLEDVRVGDALWFAVNNQLIGFSKVLRIEEDNLNAREELWVDTGKMVRCTGKAETHCNTSSIGLDLAERWLQYTRE